MQNIEYLINEVLEEAKELEAQRRYLDVLLKKNDHKAGKICYLFYKEFVKNNWDSLHKNGLYYRLIFDSELIVERIVFDAIYDTIAVFQPVNKPKMNINLLKDLSEEDYEVGIVIIDKTQLDWISQRFKIDYR